MARASGGPRRRAGGLCGALAARLAAACLLFAVTCLAGVESARAQNVELFSETMTVGAGADFIGYIQTLSSGSLTGNTFTHLGTEYQITSLYGYNSTDMEIALTPGMPETAGQQLTLHLGSRTLRFSDANFVDDGRIDWTDTGVTWTNEWNAGDEVAVRIVYRDTDPPTIESATVDSWWVTLTFSEALDESQTVSANRFRVYLGDAKTASQLEGGQVRPVGRTVTLKTRYRLNSRIEVSYSQPSSGGIQDLGGNRAQSFTRHRGTVLDSIQNPTLLQVDIDGNEMDLTYNWGLNTSRGAPDAAAFSVRHPDGTEVAVTGVRLGGAGGVTLTLASAARYGEHGWTVSYDASRTTRPLRVGNGNVRSFRGFVAINHTLPTQAPRLVRAVWHSGDTFDPSTRTVRQRHWIRLTYDQSLETTAPPMSAYTVTANGAATTVSGTSVFNEMVIVRLSSAVASSVPSCELLVSYDPPASNAVTGRHSNQAAPALNAAPVNRLQSDGKGAPCEGLSVADAEGTEGTDSAMTFTVTLSPARTSQVTVRYATSDGSARQGSDYTRRSGTLTFAAGETTKTVTVPIIDDSVEDDGETFTLTLSSASGATIVDATATGTIRNTEVAPQVTAVELVADASGDRAWSPGETIEARLTFSEAVTVSGGSPWLEVSIDGFAHNGFLGYASGSGSETLVFSTQVPAGANAFTGLAIVANSLVAGGASIASGTGVAAELAHDGTEPTAAPGTGGTQGGTTKQFEVKLKGVPGEHDGSTPVVFEVEFTKNPEGYSYRTMRDSTLVIRQGGQSLNATRARRLNRPHNDRWEVTITPVSKADLAVSIGPFSTCTETGAVCAANDEVLANEVSKTIQGPPGLSVADARVDEDSGDPVVFAVTLGRASKHTVTVDYATSDGTGSNAAVAGEDYTETSGSLTFAAGVTEQTVSVPVLDDSHDEGAETFTLTLSNPQGGNAWLKDATATGTIVNTDAMPRAWLARFGRTVAEQVIGAVEGRFSSGRTAGAEMTLAGERIGLSGPGSGSGAGAAPEDDDAREAAAADAEARSRLEAMTTWLRGDSGQGPGSSSGAGGEDGTRAGFKSRAVTGRDLLTGSSFALTAEANAGGTVSLWGRGAVSRFDGREGDLTLDGEVVSAMMGADWVRERWTAGLLLSRSVGEGGYRGPTAEGEVESTLTGLFPYGRYEASERVTLWGVAGYGTGDLVLTPKGQSAMRTDMDLAMGAVGLRGVAVEAPAAGGVELTVKTDALAVRTTSGKTEGLEAAEVDVTRVRLGLEGTWLGLEAGGGTLSPRLEVGVRHDGGDAETGFGLDLGGGLAWSHPAAGLSAELSGRGLLTHESRGLRDRGLSGSFAWEPGQGSGRGPSLTLTQTVGASASGGMDALLGRGTMAGLAANDDGSGAGGSGADDDLANRRLELRMGYGFSAFGDRFTATPELGLGLSNDHREYTLGWRLDLVQGGTGALELGLEATRREATGANDDAPAEHGVRFGLTARF